MKSKKKNVLKETFGTLKIKKSTDKIMRELDKELYLKIIIIKNNLPNSKF